TGGVTGFTTPVTGLPLNHVISDLLHNPTDAPQTVTYTIYPVNPSGSCAEGPEQVVVITVNPTPQVVPVVEEGTLCNDATTGITLTSPSTFSNGNITFRYTVVATGGVTGFTTPVTGLPLSHVINDILHNPTDAPQTVTYTIYPVNPSGSCAEGPAQVVVITVNPTPRIFPEPDADNIRCDNTPVNIVLQSPSTFTSGVVTINLTATAPAGLSGFTTSANGLPDGYLLIDNLVNSTDAPLAVTYNLVPVSGAGCIDGPTVTFTVTVNPTPRVTPVNVKPAICFGDNTEIRLISPTEMTSGEIRFDYTINLPGGVSGNGNPDIDKLQGEILSFIYLNYNDSVRSVNFNITPKVAGLNCPSGNINIQEVQVHPKPARGIIITRPFTCETSSGLAALEAVISRGADPYSLLWSGPVGYSMEDSIAITNLYAGNYILNVTDNLGCQGDTAINIVNRSASPRIIPYANPIVPSVNISCPGGSDGTARIYVSSGITPPYTYRVVLNDTATLFTGTFTDSYLLSDPSTFRIITDLAAGQYKLITQDINGCETFREAELKEPEPIVVLFGKSDFNGSNVSCRGYSDGSATANVTGGNGSYAYFWYPETGSLTVSVNENLLDSIPAGKYYLQVTDLLGCARLDSVTLVEAPGMMLESFEVSQSNDGNYQISCNGATDGYIDINISGGSGIYTYLWIGPDDFSSTQGDISGLKAGNYRCTVTDINGCILTPQPSFDLTQPEILDIAYTSSVSADGSFNINCSGGTGSINVTVTGGSEGSYVYDWSTIDGVGIVTGQEDQNALRAGSYQLRVTDGNGCLATVNIPLTQPQALVTELVPTHITCEVLGLDNGSVNLTLTGGIEPYTYNWSNGMHTQDISDLVEGSYSVTVTDANGCSQTDSTRVNLPPDLTYNSVLSLFNGYNVSCYGSADGSIRIEPTSGTPPYIYSWQGPGGFNQTTDVITGLKAGQYIFSISDINLCTAFDTVTLTEPGRLSMNFTPSLSITGDHNINCAGAKTGSITVDAINNAGPVEYLWVDGEIGNVRNDLKAGAYKIVINDSNNCQADSVFTLTEPEPILLAFEVEQPFCTDMPNGVITLSATGGAGSYTYLWSDNSTTQNITTAVSGLYSVKVT
ncbi:MAG: PKD-like domain-containing protein, partial [Bacteroidales bacterium]